ncbi:hypothetical protein SIID45300_01758 [Candidatus Magnetaquicoccaceae bacterium FCR-1]|uniref:DUF1653 domain-containing protein n=1 Tax=Candidatus Magnetaquiglobus chichijimensis TaxID=3141448 RepID=A0ABQ0C976_9PROT
MMFFRHIKTGHIYRLLAHATYETSARAVEGVVVYCPLDIEHAVYVREERDFEMTFEMVTSKDNARLNL